MIADVDAWMVTQRVQNPKTMTGMLAPGFDERPSSRGNQ